MLRISPPEMRDGLKERDCFCGDLRFAIIEHHPAHARPYSVRRIGHTLSGKEIDGGCDQFRKLSEARSWVLRMFTDENNKNHEN